MNNLVSETGKRFSSLLDAVAADPVDARPLAASDGKYRDISDLGPSVGDDGNLDVPMLGPSVGDDARPSNIRLKQDVHYIGTTVFGLPLYRFKYVGRPETYEGVMAHEVMQVMPSAVSSGADGYYRVNYGALGTSMRQIS
jgi:Chaperone of endosialidase